MKKYLFMKNCEWKIYSQFFIKSNRVFDYFPRKFKKIMHYIIIFDSTDLMCEPKDVPNIYILSINILPQHGISNNVVCATSKASDQPAHTCRLIRAFASRLNILTVKLQTKQCGDFKINRWLHRIV